MNLNNDVSSKFVNFIFSKTDARKKLVDLLESKNLKNDSKVIIWDEVLLSQFDLFAESSLFTQHKAVHRKLAESINKGIFSSRSSVPAHVVFIVRPILSVIKQLCQLIRKQEQKILSNGVDCHLWFAPRKSYLCLQKLQEEQVYGTFCSIDELKLEAICLEDDVLSCEYKKSFTELHLDKDNSSLFHSAKALMKIQKHYGIFPSVYGKGTNAKKVISLLQKMTNEEESCDLDEDNSQIDRVLVIDRSIDLLTPLLTQLTYEGLIDEKYGIEHTFTCVPPEKFVNQSRSSEVPTEYKKISLTSKSALYTEIRDKSFNTINSAIKQELNQLKTIEKRKDEIWGNLKEAHQYVKDVPEFLNRKSALSNHIAIIELLQEHIGSDDFQDILQTEQDIINFVNTDKINSHIEDCIFQRKPITQVLRLICLQSICNNGLKQKIADYYKREILQTYGYKHLLSIDKLEKCNLFKIEGINNDMWNYNIINRSLHLTVDSFNEQEPNDISYVYNGYAPLSVKLAQILSNPGWRSIEEVLKLLPGPTINDVKLTKNNNTRNQQGTGSFNSSQSRDQSCLTLVFFIGGVTYSEISALRFLTSEVNDGTDYLVATTDIINGEKLINQIIAKN